MDGVFFGVVGGCILSLIIAFNAVRKQKGVIETIQNKAVKDIEYLLDELIKNKENEKKHRDEMLESLKRIELMLSEEKSS